MPRAAACILAIWCGCAASHGPVAPPSTAPAAMASSVAAEVDAADAVDAAPLPSSTADASQALMYASYIALPGVAGCRFYACRDAEHPCGADGCYRGFGGKDPADRDYVAFIDTGAACL